MTEFNTDLAVRVLVEIEKDVRGLRTDGLSWNQENWAEDDGRTSDTQCGTAFCFAGWACHLEGVRAAAYQVAVAAEDLLGLSATPYDPLTVSGRVLFEPDNAVADLYDEVARQAGMTPDDLRGKVAAEGGWAA